MDTAQSASGLPLKDAPPDPQPAGHAPRVLPETHCPVVGIGASAGGLEAFNRLLRHLPPDTGYGFVLVQHLDASHPSSLSEILGRATTMPVVEAVHDAPVVPNHVYVIPPNTELTITDGVLRLVPRTQSVKPMTVDRFLQSLAEDGGSQMVGIVLSGNGSDGAVGLRAVKDAGGVTFAQEPASAEFRSMPSAAIAAGGTDLILSPESIAAELARMAHHPYFDVGATAPPDADTDTAIQEESLRTIRHVMHNATGIDFSLYRQTMVLRRIQRRLAILNLTNLGAYAQQIVSSPAERTALQRDLLIGVTGFFRDPQAFDALKTRVFPVITRDRPANSTIRIWVAGCATGEEAYSILIGLQEFQNESGTTFPVQLFASDINETVLEKARNGLYPESIALDVSADRLSAHFVKINGSYQIAKSLREQCLFSHHNLLDDPPFSRLDLISCRNVLIYLDTVQSRVIPLFHYALLDRGFLMLGRSEATHHEELFAAVEPRQRIYVKRQVHKRTYESFARTDRRARDTDVRRDAGDAASSRFSADLSRDVDQILLSKYRPSGVVVDDSLEVLEFRGRPAPFLGLTSGKAGLHLLKHIPDTRLFLELERLIRVAATTGEVVRQERVPYDANGRSGEVSVEVASLPHGQRRAFLVLFEGVDQDAIGVAHAVAGPESTRDSQIAKLTRELEAARTRLMASFDATQTSDDESQQIAEDALSANEELQSLTEELETAKEELQSTNEELVTVNRELESRNVALVSALELARSIVQSVPIPFIVIDGGLLIRQTNSAFLRTFQLSREGSEGQPFYELCDGVWDVSALRVQLDRLIAGGQAFDSLEIDREFPSLGMRTLVVGGVQLEQLGSILLSIQDITRQREAEKALHLSEEQRRQSEKMESIGRLAGGIAHDFNNLLTVIIGNAELVAEAAGLDQQTIDGVTEIRESASKAAALTDQLLTFGRRKILQPKTFDLNDVIADFEKMLRRLLGERIKIVVRPNSDACPVRADPTEIGRVLLNLCLNARDAMPTGGVLTIETMNVSLEGSHAAQRDVPPGKYVRLVVADNGLGMDDETRRHAFEPFFTTKDLHQGSGLGLATTFGIVQQSGGSISCESELGRGTRFEVLLPVAAGTEGTEYRNVERTVIAKGFSEVVLLVEDDDAVRGLTKRVLELAGYVVLAAEDGRKGLSVLETHTGEIDILISDVLMPEMSGGALMERAMTLRPDLKVLFVSGYPEDVLAKEGVTKGTPFLQKPYAPGGLARKVREVLDA